MVKKVYFDAGHGKYTPGKRSPSGKFKEREWFFNNEVAIGFEKEMKKYKNVKLCRTDDRTGSRDVPLGTRTNKANNANADVYVSFHHNALYNGKWGSHTGTETYYHAGSSQGKKLAQAVQSSLLNVYKLRDRGIKTANLHITRETKMPAILIEGGFMDSTIDIKKMRKKSVLRKAGKAVAKEVAGFLGLTKGKSTSKPSKSKPSKTSNTGGSVVDYMKSKGMDSSYDNRKKLAKKYGIKGYSGTESQNIKLLNKLKGGKPAKSKKSSTALPSGVLRRGSRGNDVKQLQRALNKAYFKVGKVDGIYGARTQDAVERFQKVFDAYNVDGVYGPRTKRRLEKVLK